MKLQRIRVENFKNLSNVEIHINPDVNIFTGINNSGKTTVLEAIALWAECFRKLVRWTGKGSAPKGLPKGVYFFGLEHNYIDRDSLTSVRCPRFADIFHELDESKTILLDAEVVADDGTSLSIPFEISRARGGNYDIVLKDFKNFDYLKFNAMFTAWPDPIRVVFASPVAFLHASEDFETLPKIRTRQSARESIQVLRNRLYQLKKNPPRYAEFIERVSRVLNDGKYPLELHFEGDETQDVELVVQVRLGPKDAPKDISLLGSGTLQIIEILLGVQEASPGFSGAVKDLNLVLLDEPDSHIHRDIQRRLLTTLREQTQNCQMFISTHNESLLRASLARHIFHLDPGRSGEYRSIDRSSASNRIKEGLLPSRHAKVLTALGNESALDFLNALEAEKLVLVEGEDDAPHIQAIVEKQFSPAKTFPAMYWSFRGISNMLGQIKPYKQIFSLIRNAKSLWDKAVLVCDSDDFTEEQRLKVSSGLTKELGRPVFIWPSYTLESTVLADPDKLSQLLVDCIRVDTQRTVDPDVQAVQHIVQQELVKIRDRIRNNLQDEKFMSGVMARLMDKRAKLEALGVKGAIEPNTNLQFKFTQFVEQALQRQEVHVLATKDDVLSLVRNVYAAFGAPFDELNYFLRLIEASSVSTRFDSWSELAKLLLKP